MNGPGACATGVGRTATGTMTGRRRNVASDVNAAAWCAAKTTIGPDVSAGLAPWSGTIGRMGYASVAENIARTGN
jgi:hypothetical protein